MNPSPAFQFYPADFLVGTADLSAEETGAYIRLLCFQWAKGSLPNDDRKLAALACVKPRALAPVRAKFKLCEDGNLRNDRLEKIRLKQEEFRHRQAVNGARGGRRHGLPDANPGLSQAESQTEATLAKSGERVGQALHLHLQSSDNTPLIPQGGGDAEIRKRASEIYAAFPRKAAREDALRAIRKALVKKPAALLLERTIAYARAVVGMELRHVPHAATWFNACRYEEGAESWNPDGKRVAGAASTAAAPVPEPDQWKTWLNHNRDDSIYAAGGSSEAHQWSEIPRHAQEAIRSDMRKESQ